MAKDYTKSQNTALKLLTKFGKDFIIRRKTKTDYDPSTNSRSEVYSEDYTVKGVRLDYDTSQIDGQVIQRGDYKLLCAAKDLEIEPLQSDLIVEGDCDTYKIINIYPFKPADIVVYYELQIRL